MIIRKVVLIDSEDKPSQPTSKNAIHTTETMVI